MKVARQGDGIDHGGIILTGSSDTFCDMLPVARVTDTAICDVHGEVTIIGGAIGTYTNGLQTAREFDLLSCGGFIVRNIEDSSSGGVNVSYNGASYTFYEEDFAGFDDDDEATSGIQIYRHPSIRGTPLSADEKERNDKLIANKEANMAKSTADTTPTNNKSVGQPVECNMFTDKVDYNMKISKHFTLKELSLGVALPTARVNIVAQRGLSIPQICCNMKGLATNILDPLADQYGKSELVLTSVFRLSANATATSQHPLGMAADIQFASQLSGKLSSDAWWERVLWIKNNLPYDQFILEYLGNKPWCHVSFGPANRRQLLTFFKSGDGGNKTGLHRL